MKNSKLNIRLLIATILLYGCEKPAVDSKIFVERTLLGKWALKNEIKFVVKNNLDTIKPIDSVKFNPIDTVEFTNDLKYITPNTISSFIVDDLGENIKFETNPDSTWNIDYFRKSSFKIVFKRKEISGSDEFLYVIERDFIK